MEIAVKTPLPMSLFRRSPRAGRAPKPGFRAEIAALVMVVLSVLALSPARAAEPAPGALERALDTVFTVRTADDADRFLGTAFLWGEEGEVAVTAAHVLGGATDVRLTDAEGREEAGRVIAVDAGRDVAVIAVVPGRPGLVPGAAPGLGQEVWAIGAPLGLDLAVTDGMVSALDRQVEPAVPLRLVQHDAAVNPGSSGGPLVDAEGRLLGMNVLIADGSRTFIGIAYAIGAADLDRIVTGLVEETLLPMPDLGLRARPVDRQVAAALGLSATGLLVDEVASDGRAGRAGLRAGDVILAVEGVAIERPGDLAFAVEAALDRGAADFAVLRGGAAILVMVDLTQAEVAGTGIRDISGGGVARVVDYSLDTLGVRLDEAGRILSLTGNSPALRSGLAEGDRILALNGVAMDAAALRAARIDAPALVLVQGADGRSRHVMLDPWARAGGLRPVGGANVLDPAVVVF